jgi:Mn-dependent DtxR family transcriptional regulator
MQITNRTEKRIYDLLIQDIYKSVNQYSVLTNVEIGKVLDVSPITVRDKVIKLRKQGHLICLTNYFDDNNKYFARKILKGETAG